MLFIGCLKVVNSVFLLVVNWLFSSPVAAIENRRHTGIDLILVPLAHTVYVEGLLDALQCK